MPVIDHGLDELKVWAFNLTGYNQEVIKNNYSLNMWNATKSNHVPHWGQKLFTPAFFREEKMEAFKQTMHLIRRRLDIFTSLPLASLSKMALENTARDLASK